MINDVSRVSGYAQSMTLPSLETRRNDLFNKVDANNDGGIDKVEISDLAKKLSEDTGNTLTVEDIYSTYDADGDGKLSKTELDGFMRENAPPPPQGPKPAEITDDTSNVQDILSSYDTDEDGQWSAAELQSFLLQNFSQSAFFSQKALTASGLVDRSI
jgi:Ca2+-binding EF-hand superfamily protein